MASKLCKLTKPIFVILFLLLCILPISVNATSSLGFVESDDNWYSFGASSDSSYSAQTAKWTFADLSEDRVRVFIPSYGTIDGTTRPYITFNKPANYDVVYTIYDPISAASETISYNGSGLSCYPFSNYSDLVGTNKYISDIQIHIYPNVSNYTELIGTWQFLGQWVIDTYAFSSSPTTYGTFVVDGSFEYGGGYYEFDSLRWSYVSSTDRVNLVADTLDSGSFDIITSNEILVSNLTISGAPNGEPGRLLSFLLDNASNSSSQTFRIDIGGLPADTYSDGISDTMWSLKLVILNLKSQIEQDLGDFYSWMLPSLDKFFSFKIGIFSIGGVFGALLSIAILIAFLKIFVGG